ncbi:MAG: hypothetical protein AAF546_09665 [Verrucomicrobiota bacterium]
MKPWLRRTHIILSIGGGFAGVALTLQAFFTTQNANSVLYAIIICFIALYSYGIIAGLRFTENEENKKSLIIFYWLQVPWISTPIIGYRFAAGFHVSCAMIGSEVSGFFRFGSDWNLNLFQAIPWGAGLNVFALAMAISLMKHQRKSLGETD